MSSTMTSLPIHAVRKDTDSLLTCAVCMEPFRSPKILPDCQHTFCLACLQSCYKACQDNRPVKLSNMPCPTCRKTCFLPNGGVEELPSDFKIEQFKEIVTKLCDNDEDRLDCSVCLHRGIRVTAVQNCSECNMNFCQTCTQAHVDNSLFSNHSTTVIDYDKLKREAEARSGSTLKCPEHKEVMRYFCEECESPVCNVCVLSTHDKHKVHSLEGSAEVKNDILSKRLEKLENQISKVGYQNQVLQEILKEIQNVSQESINSVKKSAEKARQAVAQLEQQLLEDLATRQNQAEEEINMEAENLKKCSQEAEKLIENLRNFIQQSNNTSGDATFSSLSVEARQLSQRLQQMNGISNDLRKCCLFIPTALEARDLSLGTTHYTDLEGVAKLKRDIEAGVKVLPKQRSLDTPTALREEIAEVMRLRERRLSQPINDIQALRAQSPSRGSPQLGQGVPEVEPVEEAISQIDGFRRCRSVCFTAQGELAAVDNSDSGERVKIFGEGWRVGSKLTSAILAKPWGVCYDNYSSCLVVTDHGHSPIKIIKPNLSTNDISMIRCGLQRPTGVAATTRGEYIVTDAGPGAPYSAIYGQIPNGRVTKLHEFGGEEEGRLICPNFVCVDSQDRILVTDCEQRDIKVFNRTGGFLFKFSVSAQNGEDIIPQGICVDESNNILVADQMDRRVIRCSPDGELIHTVVEFTDTPWGIAYNTSSKVLAISTDTSVLLHHI